MVKNNKIIVQGKINGFSHPQYEALYLTESFMKVFTSTEKWVG